MSFNIILENNSNIVMNEIVVLNTKLFSRLPDVIIYKICIYTGKFIFRYDKKINKTLLVSIIDLNNKLWITFNRMLLECFIKRITTTKIKINDRITINTGMIRGEVYTRTYINMTLPPPSIPLMSKYMNFNSKKPSKNKYK